jgi:hypothetical protein
VGNCGHAVPFSAIQRHLVTRVQGFVSGLCVSCVGLCVICLHITPSPHTTQAHIENDDVYKANI